MNNFVSNIIDTFKKNENKIIAEGQANYMRNRFEFFGLKSQERRTLQGDFFKASMLPLKSELEKIVKALWTKPQRELHYAAQELAKKYIKNPDLSDIELYEYMVVNNSWWDTVDFIASHLMGAYFKRYPGQREPYITKWLASGNIWLQRCAILFQLKYKESVDTKLLTQIIDSLLGSNEFFINKAIGWMLREYSKTNPKWVADYVSKTDLSLLSRKEAVRLIA